MKVKRNRILSILLSFALLGALLPVCAVTASAEGPWDGGANIEWYVSQAGDSYTISSAEDLAGLAALVNAAEGTVKYDGAGTVSSSGSNSTSGSNFSGKTITMTADMDVSGHDWTPISHDVGWMDICFAGTFDGAGYKITGLTIGSGSYFEYTGLFGQVDSTAMIKNVGLEGVSICCYEQCGAIAGFNSGTIENCYSTGTIIASGAAFSGGIAGFNLGAIESCYSSCAFSADVGNCFGGIAAMNGSGGKLINTYWDSGNTAKGVYSNSGTDRSVGLNDSVMKGGTGSITYYTSNDTTATVSTLYDALNGGIALLGSGGAYKSWLINTDTNNGYPVLGIPVGEITLDSQTGVSSVGQGASLQMTASVSPSDAEFGGVAWSVENGTGSATISKAGLLQAESGGTVTVRATATDGTGIYCEKTIMITVPVTGISILGENGSSSVVNGSTLQMYASISPSNATYTDVCWSVTNGTGSAAIDENGLLTGTDTGTVTVRATEYNNSQIYGEIQVSITDSKISVTQIKVAGKNGAATVEQGGALQMTAAVTPSDATNPGVTWSVENSTGSAAIDENGLLTATGVGTVTVTAVSKSDPEISGQTSIEIYKNSVTGISVTGKDGATTAANGSTLQMTAAVTPSDATNPGVTWSTANGTGSATIDENGLLTATGVGTVTVKATSNDNPSVCGTVEITVSPSSSIGWYLNKTGDSYFINSAEDLSGLAALVNAGSAGTVRYDDTGIITSTGKYVAAGTDFTGKTITMTGDIDLSGYDWTPIGNGSIFDERYYCGTFDGAGYRITGLTIGSAGNPNSTLNDAGLFGYVSSGAYLKNIGIENAAIYSTNYGQCSIGGIAGKNNNGTILNCHVAGTLSSSYCEFMGGIVGDNNGTILNCYVTAKVSNSSGSTGGIAGDNNGGTISNCYVTAKVSNSSGDTGGIAGYNLGTISNCYAAGSLSGDILGGIAGTNGFSNWSGTVINSYWKSGMADSGVLDNENGTVLYVSSLSDDILKGGTGTISYCPSYTNSTTYTTAAASNVTDALNGGISLLGSGTTYKNWLISADKNSGYPYLGKFVEAIDVTSGSASVLNGKTLQMTASAAPSDASDPSVTWSVISGDTGGSATINASGMLTAAGVGTVTVKATANDGSKVFREKQITITNPVTQITVAGEGGAASIFKGRTLQMSATVLPSDATDSSFTWSVISDDTGGSATINASGLLTATGVGTVTVRAAANDGSEICGETTVTITSPVTGIAVSGANGASAVVNGQALQMTASVLPSGATEQSVTWSVVNGTGSATISDSGVLTATGVGTVTVRATANDGSGAYGEVQIEITASSVLVTGITVEGGGAASILNGKTLQMKAIVTPSNATNPTVAWSVVNGSGSASINEAGVLTATGVGTVTVRATATDGTDINGETEITVTNPVTSISVSAQGGVSAVFNGKNLQMSATVLPSEAKDKSFTWSVVNGTGSATISGSGLLTPTYVGTVSVRAAANDGSGVCGEKIITITNPVTAIVISGKDGVSSILNGKDLQMNATVSPADATDKSVVWSITDGAGSAAINAATGVMTATGVGAVTVRATANDGSGIYEEKTITVTAPAAAIFVSAQDGVSSVFNGKTLQMSATVSPSGATDKSFTWSVINGTGSAAIDKAGLLTAKGIGTVIVRAMANDGSGVYGQKMISITIPVKGIAVEGYNSAEHVFTGKSLQMSATISPADATEKSVTWSVVTGTGSATIDDSGLLTAAGVGTVTVRATAKDGSGVYGEKTITITKPVAEITVAGKDGAASVFIDRTLQMNAVVTPADATDNSFTWSVVNGTGSATIDQTGLLTAASIGTVTVRATANDGSGVYGEKTITITKPVAEITVAGKDGAASVFIDRTLQMNATISPSDATVKSVTWSVVTGTGSATIDQTGLLTAASVGTVTVRATAKDGSGVYGEKTITITKPVVQIAVTSDNGAISLVNGTSLQMTALVTPSDAADKSVLWNTTNDTGSATIEDSGLLTATSIGTVTVRATAKDSSGVYGEITIEVTSSEIKVTKITVTPKDGTATILKNDTLQMSAAVSPSNATNPAVTWTVANGTGSATISETGLLTATGSGTVTVTATAKDGSGITGKTDVKINEPYTGNNDVPVSGEPDITVTGDTATATMNSKASASKDNVAVASISAAQMRAAVYQVKQEAEKDGLKNTAVQMNVEADNHTTGMAVTLPESALDYAVDSGVDQFTILSPAASITLDDISLSAINSYTNGDVTIRASLINEAGLTNKERELIGNRPVYDIMITSGDTTISNLGGGTATVSIPYTLSDGEDPNKIVIYCISSDGRLATVPNCVYDASAHTVTFTTTHFSTYAVGYSDVNFSDVSGWYQNYVSFLAARNIIHGTSSTTFSPNEEITRAQFAMVLANLSGNDLSEYTTSSFTDVSTTDWYFRAAEWAFENGVAVGSGGRFDPNASMTREQMAVMLYNYAKYAWLDVSNIEGMAIREFSDYGSISNWAITPIQWAMNKDILSGNSDGSFAPTANATRAQAAKTVALLLQSMIGYKN